jgi:dihydropteroate synthase
MHGNPVWRLRDLTLHPGNPSLILGIVNVTPDSFSDGGKFSCADEAIRCGLELVEQGAGLLDIGGESSRPGAVEVSLEEELHRVIPVIKGLAAKTTIPLSVDTRKAEVARRALEAGAQVVNDITALTGDEKMAGVVANYGAGVILMHMQGIPATMQQNPTYDDVVAEVVAYLQARLQTAVDVGIAATRVVLDPGIGFGKSLEHNLSLLANLNRVAALGRPVCLGVSRKGFLGQLLGRPRGQRLIGSLAAACHGMAQGGAHILRVHEVAETRDVVCMFHALDERRKWGTVSDRPIDPPV